MTPRPARHARCHAQDSLVQGLLEEAWTLLYTDIARLKVLCDEAVQRANQSKEPKARLWAHLTRAVLGSSHLTADQREADLAIADVLLDGLDDARARHLQVLARGMIGFSRSAPVEARACFESLPLLSTAGSDDVLDYFTLHGRASCAIALSDLEQAFEDCYATLLIAERIGVPVLICQASCSLAAALLSVRRFDEVVALLEQLVERDLLPPGNPKLRAMVLGNLALTKSELGRAEEALQDMLAIQPVIAEHVPQMALVVDMNLASLCIQMGRLEDGMTHLSRAYPAAYRSGRSSWIGSCHLDAARLLHAKGEVHAAIDALLVAGQDAQADPNALAYELMSADALLAQWHAEIGNYHQAYLDQRRHQERMTRQHAQAARGQMAAQRAKVRVCSRLGLTAQELACLEWCAAGKTAWETGQILGLSEWTVVYHLDKVKRKFGLNRKQQIVARAMMLGLLAKPAAEAAEA